MALAIDVARKDSLRCTVEKVHVITMEKIPEKYNTSTSMVQ